MALASSGNRRPQKARKVGGRIIAVGAGAVVALVLVTWFVLGGDSHFDTQDPAFMARRLKAEQGELWGQPAPWVPLTASARTCNPRARNAFEKLFSTNGRGGFPAIESLDAILIMDHDCVPAMRAAVEEAARQGKLANLHATLLGRAERETLNVTAQIGAAIFSDHAGRSGDMLAFLTRAETLRPDTVGLAATWADYHRFHTSPIDAKKVLEYWKRELSQGDDPRTMASMISFFAQVADRNQALAVCERFYKALPAYVGASPARTCLKQAAELNDDSAIAAYAARLEAAGDTPACQQRWVTYFRFMSGQPEARAKAAATDTSCPRLFSWLRGAALLAQSRQSVGAAALVGAADVPPWVAAASLALNGNRQGAATLLKQAAPSYGSGPALLAALLEHDLIEPSGLVALFAPPFPATQGGHLAQAACGYLSKGFEGQAQQLLAQAVSANPTDPFVRACQLRWFVAHNDLAGAEAVAARNARENISHPFFTAELAHLRAQQNRCGEALQALEAVRNKLPLEPTLYTDLTRCLRREGRNDEADKWAQLIDPNDDTWMWVAALAVVVALLAGASVLVARGRARLRSGIAVPR